MPISILPQKPPYIPQHSWDNLVHVYGSADNVCRRDASGSAYIDVDAMDALVESTGARPVIREWQRFKSQADGNSLHSAGPHDAVAGWREFMAHHQSGDQEPMASHQSRRQEFTGLAQHPYRHAEDAWTAAKNVEPIPAIQNVNLVGMADYLTRLVEAMRSPESDPGTGDETLEAPAEVTVGDCFAQAGLWWVAVFFFALVVLIIGVIVTGGGLAAVAAGILGILIGAGIWATLGGIIALVVCLGGSLDIEINY
jgi:hypothetical protein